MELDTLIRDVERQADSDDPLDQLRVAVTRHVELSGLADRVLDHFVQQARDSDCSWAQIGDALGVTKQAAQQRHGPWQLLSRLLGPKGARTGSGLFQRFTDRARRCVTAAQTAARELGHDEIDTEHVLLGLFTEPQGIAAKLLAGWGVSRDDVVHEIEERVGRGSGTAKGHIPFTGQSKKALELALRQALSLHHNYIGTEHILLGVIQTDGVAAQILQAHEVNLAKARDAVVTALGNQRRS
jgi:hypothetical protein